LLVAANRHIVPALAEGPVDKAENPPADTVADGRLLQSTARGNDDIDAVLGLKQLLELRLALGKERFKLIAAVPDHGRNLCGQHRGRDIGGAGDEKPLTVFRRGGGHRRRRDWRGHTAILLMGWASPQAKRRAERARKFMRGIVPSPPGRCKLRQHIVTFTLLTRLFLRRLVWRDRKRHAILRNA
jgi:hypothetical protein